jgi:hypothetical protein
MACVLPSMACVLPSIACVLPLFAYNPLARVPRSSLSPCSPLRFPTAPIIALIAVQKHNQDNFGCSHGRVCPPQVLLLLGCSHGRVCPQVLLLLGCSHGRVCPHVLLLFTMWPRPCVSPTPYVVDASWPCVSPPRSFRCERVLGYVERC